MGLFDLVQQENRVRIARNRVGQQAALIEADVSRRRANQPRDRMLLHILAHIEAQKLETQGFRQLLGNLGFAHAGRSREQKRANRLFGLTQAGARQPNSPHQGFNRRILAKDHALEVGIQALQTLLVRGGHAAGRDAGDLGHNGLDVGVMNNFLAVFLRGGTNLKGRAHLVDHVNRLVRQKPIIDIFCRQFCRGLEGVVRVFHPMVFFVVRLEAVQDFHGVFDARLVDFDFLKASGQGAVALKITPVLVIGGSADTAQLARSQCRFEDIRGIHGPTAGGPGPDYGVDFIDKQDSPRLFIERFQHGFEPFFKLPPEFCTGQHRAHIERVDTGLF